MGDAMDDDRRLSRAEAQNVRNARELEGHLDWLDTFTGAALGVLAMALCLYGTLMGRSSAGAISSPRQCGSRCR